MTAIRGYVPPTDDEGALGVHSLDQFVLAVPDLHAAQRFYANFGLDVQVGGNALGLNTFGHAHRWGSVVEGPSKRLHHLSFGCYAHDLARLRARLERNGVALMVTHQSRIGIRGMPPDGTKELELGWFGWSGLTDMTPDGRKILFVEAGDGGGPNYTVFVRGTDGSPPVRIGKEIASRSRRMASG